MYCSMTRLTVQFFVNPIYAPILFNCLSFTDLRPSTAPQIHAILIFMQTESLAQKIYAAVRLIPRGKVASYSQIAALVGNCNLRRYVGYALHKNPSNSFTPCHRVVNANGFCSGSFAFGGGDVQREKLEAEGVVFTGGHVDMEAHGITEDDFEEMRAGLKEEMKRARP